MKIRKSTEKTVKIKLKVNYKMHCNNLFYFVAIDEVVVPIIRTASNEKKFSPPEFMRWDRVEKVFEEDNNATDGWVFSLTVSPTIEVYSPYAEIEGLYEVISQTEGHLIIQTYVETFMVNNQLYLNNRSETVDDKLIETVIKTLGWQKTVIQIN